jgi:hypothetical protein
MGCVKSRSGGLPSSAGYSSNCGFGNLARAAQQRPSQQKAAEKESCRQEKCDLKHVLTIARIRKRRKGVKTGFYGAGTSQGQP